MKTKLKYIIQALILISSIINFYCSKIDDQLAAFSPILGDTQAPEVLYSLPAHGAAGVADNQAITIFFSKDIDPQKCTPAFAISPAVTGFYQVGFSALTFTPESPLGVGTYTVTVSTACEDWENRNLKNEYTASFSVNTGTIESPRVIAAGLESHGAGCDAYGDQGSATGGDWNLNSCWWDESKPMLSPSSYTFRGGDDGSGVFGANGGCADVNTDNFRLIFNNYMNPAVTVDAVNLTRISPPLNTIRLSNWSWSDCQAVAPYGCRVLTLVYAEQQASCNGNTSFGSAIGDFNLGVTAGSAAGFPNFSIEVTLTARDVFGQIPAAKFNFAMEGD